MAISEFAQTDIRGSSLTREVILEVENVTKEFPDVKVLNNLSFHIAEVEIHCLVGENRLFL
jgi:ABC-type sugar transport system ATPase subunit